MASRVSLHVDARDRRDRDRQGVGRAPSSGPRRQPESWRSGGYAALQVDGERRGVVRSPSREAVDLAAKQHAQRRALRAEIGRATSSRGRRNVTSRSPRRAGARRLQSPAGRVAGQVAGRAADSVRPVRLNTSSRHFREAGEGARRPASPSTGCDKLAISTSSAVASARRCRGSGRRRHSGVAEDGGGSVADLAENGDRLLASEPGLEGGAQIFRRKFPEAAEGNAARGEADVAKSLAFERAGRPFDAVLDAQPGPRLRLARPRPFDLLAGLRAWANVWAGCGRAGQNSAGRREPGAARCTGSRTFTIPNPPGATGECRPKGAPASD